MLEPEFMVALAELISNCNYTASYMGHIRIGVD